MIMNERIDAYYNEAFEDAFDFATSLVEREKERGIAEIRGILRHLYIRQGDDIHGRGEFGDADICATIAAYEQVLSTCEGELNVPADKTTMGLSS
jgi:hypothetical protein